MYGLLTVGDVGRVATTTSGSRQVSHDFKVVLDDSIGMEYIHARVIVG